MTAALFFVSGEARPMGSKRAMLHSKSGRVVMFDQKAPALRSWQNAVREAARSFAHSNPGFPLEGPVTVGINFMLSTPKTKRRKVESGEALPDVRPDLDKLARGALDGLTGILFVDDAQIVDLRVTKVYTLTDPGANVTLLPYLASGINIRGDPRHTPARSSERSEVGSNSSDVHTHINRSAGRSAKAGSLRSRHRTPPDEVET